MARERAANTGITLGWACPHGRVSGEGDLLCAIGWSPTGIDYGSPDGKPVRIVVMHYIPDSQKNAYLREISALARAIHGNPALSELSSAKSLAEARNRLVDLLAAATESALPDVKARMIQLEARQAAAPARRSASPPTCSRPSASFPLSIVLLPGARPIVLAQDRDVTRASRPPPTSVPRLPAASRSTRPDCGSSRVRFRPSRRPSRRMTASR